MPKYMAQFSYTAEAWKSFVHNPEDRTATAWALYGVSTAARRKALRTIRESIERSCPEQTLSGWTLIP